MTELQDDPLVRKLALYAHLLSREEHAFVLELGRWVIDCHKLLTPQQRERAERIYAEKIEPYDGREEVSGGEGLGT